MIPLLLLVAAAPPTLVSLTVDARVRRDGKEFSAAVGTHVRNGDEVSFHVTSTRDGHLSLLNYAPSGFVFTHCPPDEANCRSEPVKAGRPHVLGPFLVQRDAGWEIFDLVLTTAPVAPDDLRRFGNAKSLGGGSVVGLHSITQTKKTNLPELLQAWVTFTLYHEP